MIRGVSIGGFPALNASILTALQSADGQMSAAADSIASGDLHSYVSAEMSMSSAKMAMGAAAALARTQDDLFASTLNMLV